MNEQCTLPSSYFRGVPNVTKSSSSSSDMFAANNFWPMRGEDFFCAASPPGSGRTAQLQTPFSQVICRDSKCVVNIVKFSRIQEMFAENENV